MSENEFLLKVKSILQGKLGNQIQIKLQEVRKNNNVQHCGLIIQKPDSNIAPTIYMGAFYEMYQKGENMDSIVDRILQVYYQGEVKKPIDMDFFKDFEQVKDRIVYRVINAERNKELLKEIPHILFLDLAICFYYAFWNEELGDGMILVYNSHMKMWKTNHQELMKYAQENTKKLYPALFISLDAVIRENGSLIREELPEPVSFCVLTNKQKHQGATCILYPGVLENIADKFKSSFYLLPSSIHEVILIKDAGQEDNEFLHELIADANETQLTEDEILSDYPYYYNKSEKRLVQIRSI